MYNDKKMIIKFMYNEIKIKIECMYNELLNCFVIKYSLNDLSYVNLKDKEKKRFLC